MSSPQGLTSVYKARGERMPGCITASRRTTWGPYSAIVSPSPWPVSILTNHRNVVSPDSRIMNQRPNLFLDMGVFDDLTEKVVSVESGSAAILELPPIESHPTPEVTWFSSDGTLLYGIKYATTHHTLLILNASENDEGSYRFVQFI